MDTDKTDSPIQILNDPSFFGWVFDTSGSSQKTDQK